MSDRSVKELSPDELIEAERAARHRTRRFPRQTLFFAGVVLAVLFLASALVAGTWIYFLGRSGAPWLALLLVLALAFVPLSLATYRRDSAWLHVAYRPAAIGIGVLNYAAIAALACWSIALVGLLTRTDWPMRSIATALFAAAAIVSLAGLVNAAWLWITRVTVALKKRPREWHGRKVAIVSDLHLGNLRRARFVRRLVRKLNTLGVDAVLIAGDMFDGTAIEPVEAVAPWRELRVRHGAFFVTGNHDEFSDRARFLHAIANAGVRVLNNERVVVDRLQIAGVHDGETHRSSIYREMLAQLKIDFEHPCILLAHQPTRLTLPEHAGVSLVVSGHTHGGQFWPWTHIARRVHGPFVYGLNEFGRMQVLTSSGAGSWGPPFRVGTRAEIVVAKLVRAA